MDDEHGQEEGDREPPPHAAQAHGALALQWLGTQRMELGLVGEEPMCDAEHLCQPSVFLEVG